MISYTPRAEAVSKAVSRQRTSATFDFDKEPSNAVFGKRNHVITNATATRCVLLCVLIQPVFAQAQQASSEVAQVSGESVGPVKRLLSDTEREAETKLRKLGVRISRDDSGEVYMAQVNGPKCNDDVRKSLTAVVR